MDKLVSSVVVVLTFVLFAVAMVVKESTQDLMLEVAIFLVSVKLIIGTYQIGKKQKDIYSTLKEIKDAMAR